MKTFLAILLVLFAIGLVVHASQDPIEREKKDCYQFFNRMWAENENWGFALEKMAKDPYKNCASYVDLYEKEEIWTSK